MCADQRDIKLGRVSFERGREGGRERDRENQSERERVCVRADQRDIKLVRV